jgi:hypothetical protein
MPPPPVNPTANSRGRRPRAATNGVLEPPRAIGHISRVMTGKPTLYGRALSPDELAAIRAHVESFDTIEVIDDDMRALIEGQWPDLVGKLPLRTLPRRTPRTRPRRGR